MTETTFFICYPRPLFFFFFFFNDTATTEIYTLSLHDALPISAQRQAEVRDRAGDREPADRRLRGEERQHDQAPCHQSPAELRSEEHTSELQSPCNLVCRLLLEKKKQIYPT